MMLAAVLFIKGGMLRADSAYLAKRSKKKGESVF